jgi:hypothetical protein
MICFLGQNIFGGAFDEYLMFTIDHPKVAVDSLCTCMTDLFTYYLLLFIIIIIITISIIIDARTPPVLGRRRRWCWKTTFTTAWRETSKRST